MTEESNTYGFLRFRKIYFLMVLVFLFGAFIRVMTFYNHTDFTTGFDDRAHYEYVFFLTSNMEFPPADQGYEYFQPPMFYMIGAVVYFLTVYLLPFVEPIRTVQFISTFFGIATIFLVYKIAREIFPENYRFQLLSLSLAAILPVHIILSGVIGNDTTVAFFVSLAIYFLIVYEKQPNLKNAGLLGIASGLCMLSKYNGVIILPVLFIVFLIRIFTYKKQWKREITALSIIVFSSLLVGGWWYLRNNLVYGDPFISNIPYFDVLPLPHPVVYYLNFDYEVFKYPFINYTTPNVNYFWSQTYATVWFDARPTFGYLPSNWNRIIGSLTLILGVLLTLCILIGTFYWVFDSEIRQKYSVMFLFLTSEFFGYAYFTQKYPFIEATNARYLLPAIVPISLSGAIILDKLLEYKNRLIKIPFFISLVMLFPLVAVYFIPLGPPAVCDAFPEQVGIPITNHTWVQNLTIIRGGEEHSRFPWNRYLVGIPKQWMTDTSVPKYGHKIYFWNGSYAGFYISHDNFLKEKWKTCEGEEIVNYG